MIFPRIRDNLRNDSQLDLQHDGVKDIVCRADGYPEVDVAWIRGCSMLALFSLSLTLSIPFSGGHRRSCTKSDTSHTQL